MIPAKMMLANRGARAYHASMASLSDGVRKAIRECGMTRYEIAKRSGVGQGVLSRFMHGQNALTLTTLDKLADVLGLELIVRGKRGSRR
jgi:transcriptional regulator with XRE-family HTH domain